MRFQVISPLLAAALRLAALKFRVFPLHDVVSGVCSCPVGPQCNSGGKHPRTPNGFHDASTEPETIKGWWSEYPVANIGVATGKASGLVVIDIDPRHGGDSALQKLVERLGALPDTVEAATGGGGRHICLRCPDRPVRSRTRIAPGVDVKAEGGYVVAPPSLHQSGEHYSWTIDPEEQNLADVPKAWLEVILRPSASRNGNELPLIVGEGARNDTLFRFACSMRRVGAKECEIAAALEEINTSRCTPPLDPRELKTIAASAARYEPDADIERPQSDGDEPTSRPTTDTGNAERFVDQFGNRIRYCYSWKKFVFWDGRRWRLDDRGIAMQFSKAVVRSIYGEASKCDDQDRRQALSKWANSCEKVDRRRALVELVKPERNVVATPDQFDTNPWLLNCSNGTLDLRTLERRPHAREDYITKLCAAAYNPNARAPEWNAFLQRVLPDEEIRRFIQRAIGWCLTGDVSEQVLFFLFGPGANGKSVLLSTLLNLLGRDYAMQAPPELLLSKRSESHPTERADLFGMRLVATVEIAAGRSFDEALVKQVTGGDRIRARRMHEDFWEFDPTHKIWIAANHRPVIRGTDYAIWRRILVVPFTVTIPESERDKKLQSKLLQEREGILAWAVEGWRELQGMGLNPPEAVRLATADYQFEMDVVGQFLEDCAVPKEGATIGATRFYEVYKSWCAKAGEEPRSQRGFGDALREKSLRKAKRRGLKVYLDVALAESRTGGGDRWGPSGPSSRLNGPETPREGTNRESGPDCPQRSLRDGADAAQNGTPHPDDGIADDAGDGADSGWYEVSR